MARAQAAVGALKQDELFFYGAAVAWPPMKGLAERESAPKRRRARNGSRQLVSLEPKDVADYEGNQEAVGVILVNPPVVAELPLSDRSLGLADHPPCLIRQRTRELPMTAH